MKERKVIAYPAKGDPDTTADAWVAYLHSGCTTESGRESFKEWLHESIEHVEAYQKAEQLWRDIGVLYAGEFLGGEQPPSAGPGTELNRKFSYAVLALAASFLLVVTSIALLLPASEGGGGPIVEYASGVGEITTFTLDDDSVVTLSADSRLIAHFSEDERLLNLMNGRAYFQVAKDPQRPFVVRAGKTNARAVGTAFDVNQGYDAVTVSVSHGIVDVTAYGNGIESDPTSQQQVYAGQQINADKQGRLSAVTGFDAENQLAWRLGRLVYSGERLEVIIDEVNRFRNKKIRLLDKKLKEQRITLSMASANTDLLIDAIQATQAVSVVDTPSEVRITKADN